MTETGRSRRGRRTLWAVVAFVVVALLVAVWLFRIPVLPLEPNIVKIAYIRRGVPVLGQIGTTLEKTDILASTGIQARFFASEDLDGFRTGSGEGVDVILTGEADTLTRVARGQKGRVVATLGSGGRIGIVVRPTATPPWLRRFSPTSGRSRICGVALWRSRRAMRCTGGWSRHWRRRDSRNPT